MSERGCAIRTFATTLLCALCIWPSAHGQVNPPPPTPVHPVPFQGDTTPRNDYTWEGALIGGAATGVFSGLILASICGYDNSGPSATSCAWRAAVGLAIGAVPGFVIGGMVGSAIPKRQRRHTETAWAHAYAAPLSPKPWSAQITLLHIPLRLP